MSGYNYAQTLVIMISIAAAGIICFLLCIICFCWYKQKESEKRNKASAIEVADKILLERKQVTVIVKHCMNVDLQATNRYPPRQKGTVTLLMAIVMMITQKDYMIVLIKKHMETKVQ